VAFAVGRSCGGAVTRNRIRRRLRAAIVCSEDRVMPGGAHLFGAAATAATAPFDALVASVRTLLDRAAEPGR
jgi:ribonuclease P protein component